LLVDCSSTALPRQLQQSAFQSITVTTVQLIIFLLFKETHLVLHSLLQLWAYLPHRCRRIPYWWNKKAHINNVIVTATANAPSNKSNILLLQLVLSTGWVIMMNNTIIISNKECPWDKANNNIYSPHNLANNKITPKLNSLLLLLKLLQIHGRVIQVIVLLAVITNNVSNNRNCA